MFRKSLVVFVVFIVASTLLWASEEENAAELPLGCETIWEKTAPLFEDGTEGTLRQVKEMCVEILNGHSDCLPAMIAYGRAINDMKGFNIDIGDYFQAYEPLARALVIDPDNVRALWVMADLQRHSGHYDRAVRLAEKAVTLDPEDPYANYVLGSSLMVVNLDEAVKYLEKASVLKPGWKIPALNLSAAYIRTKQYEKALVQLNIYLKADPGEVKALTNRGVVYMMLGKLEEAETDIDKALALNPRFGLALKARADLYISQNQHEKALETYKLALVSMPDDIGIWNLLAALQVQSGLTDDAVKSYEKMIELDPKNEEWKKALQELKKKKDTQPSP